MIIGIQGGPGSFNEEACKRYCSEHDITDYTIKYLYTTQRVLKELHDEQIDRGIFAIENSIGGVVRETINALSWYNCKILDDVKLPISHCLLIHPDATLDMITTIMSHPQALAQCKQTLAQKYPNKVLISGKGDLVDQATAAQALSKGELPKTTAVIASAVCADLYPLMIVDRGLQDSAENITTFLFVSRFDGKMDEFSYT